MNSKDVIKLIEKSFISFGETPLGVKLYVIDEFLLEELKQKLTLTDVGSNEVKFFCQHKLVLNCKEQCYKCSRQPNSV